MTVTPQGMISQEQSASALQCSAWIKFELRQTKKMQTLWGLHSIQASCGIPLTSSIPKKHVGFNHVSAIVAYLLL